MRFLLDIFDYVLHHNPNLKSVSDYGLRRDILLKNLFLVVYRPTSRALLYRDHLMLAVLLAQVKLRGVEDIADELEFLLDSGDGFATTASSSLDQEHPVLSDEQVVRLRNFSRPSIFKPVDSHITDHEDVWVKFLQSNNPEKDVPTPWEAETLWLIGTG